MRVGQTRRRDAIEKPICQALRAIGAHVTQVSGEGAPDILVRYRGRLKAFEIKSKTGKQTAAQTETDWPILRSVDEAITQVCSLPESPS